MSTEYRWADTLRERASSAVRKAKERAKPYVDEPPTPTIAPGAVENILYGPRKKLEPFNPKKAAEAVPLRDTERDVQIQLYDLTGVHLMPEEEQSTRYSRKQQLDLEKIRRRNAEKPFYQRFREYVSRLWTKNSP
jgi:hypothetical protein